MVSGVLAEIRNGHFRTQLLSLTEIPKSFVFYRFANFYLKERLQMWKLWSPFFKVPWKTKKLIHFRGGGGEFDRRVNEPDWQINTHFGPCALSIILTIYITCLDRHNAIGIATYCWLDGPGIETQWRRYFPHSSRQALQPTRPPLQWVGVNL
jgi:hypothetical protein